MQALEKEAFVRLNLTELLQVIFKLGTWALGSNMYFSSTATHGSILIPNKIILETANKKKRNEGVLQIKNIIMRRNTCHLRKIWSYQFVCLLENGFSYGKLRVRHVYV